MNWRDRNPPHIHALYGEPEALVSLDGAVLARKLPRRAHPWSWNGSRSTIPSWSTTGPAHKIVNQCNASNPSIDRERPKILHTTDVKPLPGQRLEPCFNNGEAGVVDLSDELDGEMFEPLKDPDLFATAHQHPVIRTVAWSNGADLAPELLLDLLRRLRDRAA